MTTSSRRNGTRKQQQLFPGMDTALSKVADDYLDKRDAMDTAKENLTAAEVALIKAMHEVKKPSLLVTRGATAVRLSISLTESKERIKVVD